MQLLKKTLLITLIAISALGLSSSLVYAAGITIPSGSQFLVNSATLNVPGDINIGGTLQLSSGAITLTGSWVNSGTFTAGTGTVTFVATTGTPTINSPPANGVFNNIAFNDAGTSRTFTLNSGIEVNGALNISSGTLSAGTYDITANGNWSVDAINGGFSSSGTVIFNSSSTGRIIESGGSPFYNLQFNNTNGGWTIQANDLNCTNDLLLINAASFTANANITCANNFNLTAVTAFTLSSGDTLEVRGNFTNAVSNAATTWTGSTLYLNGTGSSTINTNSSPGDTYATLRVGANQDIRMWNSSAATAYTIDSGGSLYSMDHASQNGELYIWGDYNVPDSATDYWSYAADFDGTSLGGSERQCKVYLADTAQLTCGAGETLQAIGAGGYPTLITRQSGSGAYGIDIGGGTLNANYYDVQYIDADGFNISGSGVTVTNLDNGSFDNSAGTGASDVFMTVAGDSITNNPSRVISNVGFNNSNSAADYNVRATGTTSSFWDFDASSGTFDGEANDYDPGPDSGNPGYLRWDDSAVPGGGGGGIYIIQQGRTEITSNQQDISITPVSNMSRAFVIISPGTGYTAASTNSNIVMARGYLQAADNIRVNRASSSNSTWISWQVIECLNDEFLVYRGSGSFAVGQGDTSPGIGGTVVPAKCFAYVTADNDQATRTDYNDGMLTAYVDSSTTVRIQRADSSAAAVNYNWVAVEWNTAKIASIQTAESTVTTEVYTSPLNVNLGTQITPSQSLLIYQTRPASNGLDQVAITGNVINSTAIKFYAHVNTNYTRYIRWYVIDFGSGASAQRNVIDYSATSAWLTADAALSPNVDLNRTITFSSITSSGTGSNFPRPYATYTLTANNNLRTQRLYGGTNSYIEWQAVQLPAATLSVSGRIYTNEGKTANVGAGVDVGLSVNGGTKVTNTTNADGNFTFLNLSASANNPILIFIDNNASYEANLITQASSSTANITGLEMYTNKIVLRHEGVGPMNNTLLAAADNCGDDDIHYAISGNNVDFADGLEVWVDSGKTYTPAGTVEADDFQVSGTGIFNAESNAVTIHGDWDISPSGTFTSQGTVTFDGSSTQAFTTGGTDDNHDFAGLTHSGSSTLQLASGSNLDADVTLTQSGSGDFDTQGQSITAGNISVSTGTFNSAGDAGTWDIANNVTISAGTLTATSGTFTVGNSFKNTGSFSANSATLTFDAASGTPSIEALPVNGAFYNLTFNSGDSVTFSLASAVDINGALQVTKGTLAAGTNNINIAGNWTVHPTNGAFTGTNTVYFDGSQKQILSTGGTDVTHDFQDLEHSGAGELELDPAYNLDVDATLTQSGSSDFDTQAKAITCGGLSVSSGTFNNDGRAGAWDIGTGGISISAGALTATSGTFTIAGGFSNSGTFNANSATIIFAATTGTPSINAPPANGVFNNLSFNDAGTSRTFSLSSSIEVNGALNITSGTLSAGANTITADGNWTVNPLGGVFSSSGAVIFNGSSAGRIIESGGSSFYDAGLNNSAGGWTVQTDDFNCSNDFFIINASFLDISTNLTCGNNFTLANITSFNLSSGRMLEVRGQFNNSVAQAVTNWTGTTLYLNGTGSSAINTNSSPGDTYATLRVGANQDIRMWNSSAATAYTIDAGGSLYSMDHNSQNGELYIWGDYHVPDSATDYWSYAADFDGASLSGGSERQCKVFIDNGASITCAGGEALEIVGVSSYKTEIARQGASGGYSLAINDGNFKADNYNVTYIDGNGINISGSSVMVTGLDNGFFDNSAGAGADDVYITVAGAAIDNNGGLTIANLIFNNTNGNANNNTKATGSTSSFWKFVNSSGDLSGENYDIDPGGNPGYLVWDDSAAAAIFVSGAAYQSNRVNVVPDGTTVACVVNSNGAAKVTNLTSSGNFNLTGLSVSLGDSLTIYFDGAGFSGSTVTVTGAANISDMGLYRDHVTARMDAVGALSIAQMTKWDADNDADINFDAEDLATDTLVTDSGSTLFVPAGEIFQPLGSLESGTNGVGNIEIEGALTCVGSEIIRVKGSWQNSGTFSAADSTVRFNAASGTPQINPGGSSFGNVIIDSAVSYALSNSLTTTNTLEVAAGTLDAGSYTLTANAALMVNGGTLSAASGNINANSDVSISAGNLTAPGSGRTFNVGGNWTNSAGNFTSGTGKVTFNKASGVQTIDAGGTGNDNKDFNNLEKSTGGTLRLTGSGLEVDGTLTIPTSITVDLNGQSLNLGTLDNSGTLQLIGSEASVVINNMDTAKGKVLYVGNGDGYQDTFGIKDIDDIIDYHDLTINDPTSLDIFQTAADLYVNGVLEVSDGRLDISYNSNTLKVSEALVVDGGTLTAANGNIDANLDVNVTSGTLTAPTSGKYFQVAGNLTMPGTFENSSGTVTLDAASGAPTVDAGANSFYGLVFEDYGNGITFTLNSAILTNDLTITNGTLNTGSNNAITLGGNWTDTGSFVSNSGLVTFNKATGTQTINAGGTGNNSKDFNSLTKSGGGSLQLITSGLEVNGTLTVSTSTTLDLNGENLTAGALDNSGTVLMRGSEASVSITNMDTNSGDAVYTGYTEGSSDIRIVKDFHATSYDYYNLTLNDSRTTKDIFRTANNLNIAGALKITNGTLDISTNSNTLTVAEALTVNGGTLTATSGNIDANSSVTVSSGTFTAPGSGKSFTIGDDLIVAGSFVNSTGEVTFDNASNPAVLDAPGVGLAFYSFKCTTPSKLLSFSAGDTFIVDGTFTLTGSDGSLISLNSTEPGTTWSLILNAGHAVDYVNVQDSHVSGTANLPINPSHYTDSGNNQNWFPLSHAGDPNALRSGQDRHTFYDGTYFWAFYIDDDGNVVYKKDQDGVDWPGTAQTVASGNYTALGIWEDGTNVSCSYTDGKSLFEKQIVITSGQNGTEREIVKDFMMEWGAVSSVGTAFQTVNLINDYGSSMVAVTSPNYINTDNVAVTRVQNASNQSFAVAVQEPCGSAPATQTVRYLVTRTTSAGTIIPGTSTSIEAQAYTSTLTDYKTSWVGQQQAYQNSYSNPRIAGQVMTYNDANWSVFWARGSASGNPPDSSNIYTGKHVGEHTVTTRSDETIGFIVAESSHTAVNGISCEFGRTGNTIDRIADAPPYNYTFSQAFSSPAEVAAVTQVGMNGGDGAHALLYGASPLSATEIALAVDEDICADTDRTGNAEEVDYFVFEKAGGYYGSDVNHVQVIKDPSGFYWAKWENANNDVFIARSTAANDDASWGPHYLVKSSTDAANFGHNQIVPLNSTGNLMYVYQEGNNLYGKIFADPASQGSAVQITTGVDADDCATGNKAAWDDTHYFSVISDVNSLTGEYLAYLIYVNASGYIKSAFYNSNSSSWSTPVTISNSGSCSLPSLSYDEDYGTIYAFWINGTTINYKRKDSPQWPANEEVLKSGLNNPAFLSASYSNNATIGIMWREGTGSSLSYDTLTITATIVSLTDFYALGFNNTVRIDWKTAAEIDNAGFNLYRSVNSASGYAQINPSLVAGLGTSLAGGNYTYWDNNVTANATYYYILESVETAGQTRKFGPVVAHPGRDSDADGMSDDYEYYYGLDPASNDTAADPDNDGLTNLQEYANRSDPYTTADEILSWEAGEPGTAGVSVISSSDSQIVLELVTNEFSVDDKFVGNETYHIVSFPEYAHGYNEDAGRPMVPVKGILLQMQNKRPLSITVTDSEKEELNGYNIYPVPRKALVTEGGVAYLQTVFYKDNVTYGQNRLYPDKLSEIDYSSRLRNQNVAKLKFYPLQFNPVTGGVDFYNRIQLRLTTQNATAAAAAAAGGSGAPEGAVDRLKIQVNDTGIYRLTYDNLTGAGVEVAGLNPKTFRLYNKGSEIPIYVYGEGDAAFDSGDYLEFYAEKENTRYSYSNAYWLTFGQAAGLRMENKTSAAGTTPESFLFTEHHELNQFYWSEILNSDDPWYIYPPVAANTSENFTVYLDDLANTSENAEFLACLQGFNTYNYSNMTYQARVYLNTHPLDNITWEGNATGNLSLEIPSYWLTEGNNTIRVEHVLNSSYPNAWVFADWFNISYWRKFQAKDDYLWLSASGVGNYTYSVTNFSQDDIRVYDISDHDNVKRIANTTVESEGATYKVTFNDNSSAVADYALVSSAGLKTYQSITADQVSDLRNTTNQADYVIVTYDGFYNATLPLAEHRQAQGLSVKVVNLSDVYDEFNYGIASPDAIKYFLNYTYTNWQDPAPAYVLLVGDGTYDYRDDEGRGFSNYMPAHLVFNEHFGETASDAWFVCFDSEDDIFPEMLIGRFPAKTADDVQAMVNKTLDYEDISINASWTKDILLVADNAGIFETVTDRLNDSISAGYNVTKRYLANYTNPLNCREDIISDINQGALMVTYAGHGGIQIWSNDNIFNITRDLDSLTNQDKYPFMVTLNCVNGYFTDPSLYLECLAEELIRAEDKGVVAIFAPSGMSLPDHQLILAEGLYDSLFKQNERILGSAIAQAKLYLFQEAGATVPDVVQTFNLFGDPALILRMPEIAVAEEETSPSVYQAASTIQPVSRFTIGTDITKIYPSILFSEEQQRVQEQQEGKALELPEKGKAASLEQLGVIKKLILSAETKPEEEGGYRENKIVRLGPAYHRKAKLPERRLTLDKGRQEKAKAAEGKKMGAAEAPVNLSLWERIKQILINIFRPLFGPGQDAER